MHTVDTIELEGDESRTFVARFYDQAGHLAEAEVSMQLECSSGFACDGACTDVDFNEDHCGSCNRACPNDPYFGDYCYDWPDVDGLKLLVEQCDERLDSAGEAEFGGCYCRG